MRALKITASTARATPARTPRADAPRRFAGDALAKISEHVRAALAEAFRVPGAEFALLLEDGLRVAGDFPVVERRSAA